MTPLFRAALVGIAILAVVQAAAAQTFDEAEVPAPLRAGEFIAGDMVLQEALVVRATHDRRWQTGAAAFDFYQALPWPGGLLPVAFGPGVTAEQQRLLFEACRSWTALSGVRCAPRTGETRFVTVVVDQGGCTAHVGRPISGNGSIYLDAQRCWTPGTVIHELGHAFGLMHEHQRPDRDLYIDVFLENVNDGSRSGFDRIATQLVRGPYDFGSIMHYGPISGAKDPSRPVIVAKPEYEELAKNMGQRFAPTALDRAALAAFYNIPPSLPRDNGLPVFSRADFLNAMEDLDAVYRDELHRRDGLSINQRPDFLGIAAWIFDVYLASRATGYTQGEAFYNVRAWISQSEEWRVSNPGLPPSAPAPIRSPIQLDRGEYLVAMERLDEAYRTELLRPHGLSIGGRPDFLGIAAWVFDIYLNNRLSGRAPEQAWAVVLAAIRASDEYRQKH